jgi:putative glycosyltransferase (TIGR04372 family)
MPATRRKKAHVTSANSLTQTDPRAALVIDPIDTNATARFLATLDAIGDLFTWARRSVLTGPLDPITLRRLLINADALDDEDLHRWAEAATLPRRHPLRLIGALIKRRERRTRFEPGQPGTEIKDFARRVDWLRFVGASEPVPSSVSSAIEATLMKIAFHREYLDGGLIDDAIAAGREASAFSRYVRRRLLAHRVRGFTSNWTQAIGHMVVFIHILYGQKAGMFDWDQTVLATGRIANQSLYAMAEAALGPIATTRPERLYCEHHGSTLPEIVDGRFLDIFEVCRRVDAVALGRGESVLPPPERSPEMLSFLAARGVNPSGPYVTLHCREDGFKLKGVHGPRNASIGDYAPAIRDLLRRGYTVIRLGDPSMTPLRAVPGLIDYANAPEKSPALDVVLPAHAAFHIGCSSGLSLVPLLFARPCLFLNWYPLTLLPWGRQTWTAVKRLVRVETGETVSDAATLHSAGMVTDATMLRHLGFVLEDNSPQEILSTVRDYVDALHAPEGVNGPAVFLNERDGSRRRLGLDRKMQL